MGGGAAGVVCILIDLKLCSVPCVICAAAGIGPQVAGACCTCAVLKWA